MSANVTGARVLVDGQKVGKTPMSDRSVSSGSHRLRVTAEGYETYEKTIRVEPGRAVSLYVDLSRSGPRKARLFVDATPDGCPGADIEHRTGLLPGDGTGAGSVSCGGVGGGV